MEEKEREREGKGLVEEKSEGMRDRGGKEKETKIEGEKGEERERKKESGISLATIVCLS